MIRMAGFVFGLFAMGWATAMGCAPSPEVQYAASEAAYGAALIRCVDQARTLEESKTCRQRVNAMWGVVEKEAGPR